jgi:hypothetical protein
VDVDDLLDDPDLEKLHAERLAQMQREAEKRVKMQQKGHGVLPPPLAPIVSQTLLPAALLRAATSHSPSPAAPTACASAPLPGSAAGAYEEISEGDFLEAVTKTERVVCHFFHREFERCRIMDKHLGELARKHFGTRFIKLSAPDAPFFVEKLQVRMLPCVVMFVGGVAVDRIVGFDTLGAADDFPTTQVKHTRFQSARAPGGRHGCSVPLRAAPPPLPP